MTDPAGNPEEQPQSDKPAMSPTATDKPSFTVPDILAKLSSPIEKSSIDGVTPIDADDAVKKFSHDYLSDAFEAVANGISYEPYRGVLRGARGTALAGSGNAIDQALLLASAIETHVTAWRIAEGRLDDEALSGLLATVGRTYAGDHAFTADDPDRYDPINDAKFRDIAKVHYWLEVQREPGDTWLAMDPTYPDANIGQSFATATRRIDAPSVQMMQRLELSFMQATADGKTQRLGTIVGNVADLALYPIVLVSRGIPQFDSESAPAAEPEGDIGETSGGLLGGNGGLLGGGQDKAPEPPATTAPSPAERTVVGTEYRRELTYGGKEPETLKATMVTDAQPSTRISREWIEFSLQAPGMPRRLFTRELYSADSASDSPATVRRYSIAVVSGSVSRETFEGYRDKLDLDRINAARAELAALQAQPATNELALKIIKLESASALTPHLINLAFAHESDVLTERIAAGAAVTVIRNIPRILITTVETAMADDGSATTSTTLDLRLDEVHAVPYTGMVAGTTGLFQRARGMQESSLEGRVLARFVEDPDTVITTTKIMQEAQSQGKQLLLAAPDDRSALDQATDLPAPVTARINATLDAGHQVILPSGAARVAGADHWGWWDVNPDTGAFVGVMAGGQHQAMTQYTVTLEKIGLNDAMGFVIGGIVGSTATLTLYSAKMLEYGQVTPELIAEVAAGIEYLTCVTCPNFEVNVVPVSVQASFDSACFDQTGVAIGLGGGVSGGISFCEKYKQGISCAASLMLGSFEITAGVDVVSDISLSLGPLSCDQ